MDDKTLQTLEYFKILDRLAAYTAFEASAEKARALRPTTDLEEARRRQAETREALALVSANVDVTIGGARDIRAGVELARRGGVLTAGELLDVKYTLIAARTLARSFERFSLLYPNLSAIVARMTVPTGIIDVITRAISDRGEVLDSASDRLGEIRREMRISHERLMSKLQRMVNDPKLTPLLQESLITQRDGRYVLPLRAEFKGRLRSIVHDQSSSGATLFVEPIGVVDLNNTHRELQLAERDEERRILAEISSGVGRSGEDILNTVEVIAVLDVALACGKYADDLRASEPVLHEIPKGDREKGLGNEGDRGAGNGGSEPAQALDAPIPLAPESAESPDSQIPLSPAPLPPESSKGKRRSRQPAPRHPGTVIRLYEARHPLLDPATVVPIDLDLDPQTFALIITGPNTGGKTVTLKTVGLLALMAQSGLHIPAGPASEISIFQNIYADIGDEQSIEQSLSTFSGHITNIIRILERADRQSLVILDELGAGTDPQEGAALARSLLSHLLARGITTLVTTHHPELKAYAHATPGVTNASVEFDLETLRPTYRLTIGLPGRSNALAIAQRLGLPRPIVDEARSELSPEDKRSWGLLDEIYRQRDAARLARSGADQARAEADRLRRELAERLDQIEDERRALLEGARVEAETEVRALQDEMREVRRSLARARQPVEALDAVEKKIDALQNTVEKPVERAAPEIPQVERRALRPGDKVRLRSLNMQGVLTALSQEEAEVQVGMLRVRARLSDLERASGEPPALAGARASAGAPSRPSEKSRPAPARGGAPAPQPASFNQPPSPGMELDLRGQRAEDALDMLESYLDGAYLSGLPFVRIIHGKGTGRLREVVRQSLRDHPNVATFESGGEKEGGDGVTVAKFIS